MKKFLPFLVSIGVINFVSAQTHALIGTCYSGGANSGGSIFQANLDGSNLHTIYSFTYTEGAMPWGKTAQAPNGKIYGVTYLGGCSDSCTLYEYDPVTGICLDVYDFFCSTTHSEPSQNGLILSTDGNLYGLEQYGIIYKFNPVTHVYTLLNQNSNLTYYGGLVQASDGKLYGISVNGGAYSAGTIFSYDLTSNVYSVVYDFDGTQGSGPYFENLIQATDGKLYGTTLYGGANSLGVIFSYDIPSNTYTDLHDFDSACQTLSGLIQASDGKLYGVTYYGGADTTGVIFSYDISASQYSVLHNFSGTDGAHPTGGLTQASNGKLFGTTIRGGIHDGGVAFSFDITDNTFAKLADFNTASGYNPHCDIMEAVMPSPEGITSSQILPALVYLDAATHQLVIQNLKPEGNAALTVFDAPGRNVFQTEVSSGNSEFDLSAYPAGVYIVSLQNAAQTVTRKIILSK